MRKAIQGAMVMAVLLGAFAEADPIQWTTADGGNGHYYETVSYPAGITWNDAQIYADGCTYMGLSGHLVTITSAAENDFVTGSLGVSTNHYWLGGYQRVGSHEPDGGWAWITGEPWEYTNWSRGEPSDRYGGDGVIRRPELNGTDEEVLEFTAHAQWNDMEETVGWSGLIVEYDFPVGPSVIEGHVYDWLGNPMTSVKVQLVRRVDATTTETLWTGCTDDKEGSEGYYKSDPIVLGPFDVVTASLDNEVVRVKDWATKQIIQKTQHPGFSSPIPNVDIIFGLAEMPLEPNPERYGALVFQETQKAHSYIQKYYGYTENARATVLVGRSDLSNGLMDSLFGTIWHRWTPSVIQIWHEYGHFVHRSQLGPLKFASFCLTPWTEAITEGWAIYFSEYNSNPGHDDENRPYIDQDAYAYDWGRVYSSVFHDIADGPGSKPDDDFINGYDAGHYDNGHMMVWNTLMERQAWSIDVFFLRFISRYRRLAIPLYAIYGSHGIYSLPTSTSTSGSIVDGQEQVIEQALDSTIASVEFQLEWPGSDLDLTLTAPSGTTIDAEYAEQDPNMTYVEGATDEYYTVEHPEPGQWQMHITAVDVPPEGEDYTTTVSLSTHLMLILFCDKETYAVDEPVSLRAELLYDVDSYSDTNVVAAIQTPSGTETVPLFDDGLHNDANSGDGVYANVYTDTLAAGDYRITATASGVNSFGEPFVRETERTVLVQDLSDLALYDLTINQAAIEDPAVVAVRVLNEGTSDANGILVTFFDVNDADPIRIGEDIGIGRLAPGESQDVSIAWDVPAGSHDLYVVVDYLNTIPESDEANNYLTRRFCTEWKIFGDLNQDCIVNLLDLAGLADKWLESCSEPDWCSGADIDRDGWVGFLDILIIADHWLSDM